MEQIKKQFGVPELYSWSKYNTYKTSPYEYFLKYVVKPKVKEDREDSAYAPYGSTAHDILEKFYLKKIKYEDMLPMFEDALFTLELGGLKFDRTNTEKNKSISDKYSFDMKHFFKNHKAIEKNVDIERFLVIKIGNYIFQGYADLVKKDDDGNFIIQDWKSSSIYTGAKIAKESGQLILYAEGLHQLGVPLEKIKSCWNFLKYCTVTVEQANGKTVDRNIERIKIGESLKSNATMWLKKCGCEESLDEYIELLEQTNSIECLPADVQSKYKVSDCYVFIPLSQEIIDSLKLKIIDTLQDIKSKEVEYHKTLNERLFWDEDVAKESFYFTNLCGYSARLHKPYGEYLDKLKAEKENKDNVFCGIGSDTIAESDLSWLNEI